VLRVIARLNVGGPAIQAVALTDRLRPRGYETTLLRGRLSAREGSMDYLAEEAGVEPVMVPGLRRELGPADLRALWHVARWMRRLRPDVVHSHTAKAGALARLAVWLTPGLGRPVVVHTFHGHVLEGEFSPRTSRVLAFVERLLARQATRLIAVSDEVKDDLVRLGVAPPGKVEVVRLGFDLVPFIVEGEERPARRAATRQRLGIPDDARVVTVVARVVKVKRIDRFLAVAQRVAAEHPHAWFVVAGDGDLRPELERSPAATALGDRLIWAGFERDIPNLCFASDVMVLTSDNEGTPVCLIEASAAGLPVVGTRVGGMETVVRDGLTGAVVDRDPRRIAEAVTRYLDDLELARRHGRAGRDHVLATFTIERLVDDVDRLYRRLLAAPDRIAAG